MARNKKMTFLDRMKAGRKQKGGMKGYIFMFVLASVAIGMSYFVGFVEISDGVHVLNITGENVIFGNAGPSCIAEFQDTCVAPLPMMITLLPNQMYTLVYLGAALSAVFAFFIRRFRVLTYLSAGFYLLIAALVILAPTLLQFTDGVNSINNILRPTLNTGGTTVVILAGLGAFGNLIVYRTSGNE